MRALRAVLVPGGSRSSCAAIAEWVTADPARLLGSVGGDLAGPGREGYRSRWNPV